MGSYRSHESVPETAGESSVERDSAKLAAAVSNTELGLMDDMSSAHGVRGQFKDYNYLTAIRVSKVSEWLIFRFDIHRMGAM